MTVTLEIGETLWDSSGVHILDNSGVALTCSESTEITFNSQEIYDSAIQCIEQERSRKAS